MRGMCAICTDLFSGRYLVVATLCGHVFHMSCLHRWFETSNTCPACRSPATVNTIKRLYFRTEQYGELAHIESLNCELEQREKEVKELQKELETSKKGNEENLKQKDEKIEELLRELDMWKKKHALKEEKEAQLLKEIENLTNCNSFLEKNQLHQKSVLHRYVYESETHLNNLKKTEAELKALKESVSELEKNSSALRSALADYEKYKLIDSAKELSALWHYLQDPESVKRCATFTYWLKGELKKKKDRVSILEKRNSVLQSELFEYKKYLPIKNDCDLQIALNFFKDPAAVKRTMAHFGWMNNQLISSYLSETILQNKVDELKRKLEEKQNDVFVKNGGKKRKFH